VDVQVVKINVSSYFVWCKIQAAAANAAMQTLVMGVFSRQDEFEGVHALLGRVIGCIVYVYLLYIIYTLVVEGRRCAAER
jgi:hypothetical protein